MQDGLYRQLHDAQQRRRRPRLAAEAASA
jgi:hypothetical protein